MISNSVIAQAVTDLHLVAFKLIKELGPVDIPAVDLIVEAADLLSAEYSNKPE